MEKFDKITNNYWLWYETSTGHRYYYSVKAESKQIAEQQAPKLAKGCTYIYTWNVTTFKHNK